MKYYAIHEVENDGQVTRYPVLHGRRGRKHIVYDTIEQAAAILEKHARQFRKNTRGLIFEARADKATLDQEPVLTIAL
jgi:hypothetical protein